MSSKKQKEWRVPFNRPHLTQKELSYISQAHLNGQLSGDGDFTHKCNRLIERMIGSRKTLLTHSCTGALEMMGLLSNISKSDEVIMPSFTFVSTANAFVLRGGTPVFVDIREDTLNINENLIERAITKKTKAIMVIHYAGVACDMGAIAKIARKHRLLIFEDAAHSFLAKYKNKYLGAIGDLSSFSFHETKNIVSGEGGALLINNPKFSERAEIIREKGTNRSKFLRGEVDKYTWVDIGSSYLPGEITAAFLFAQLMDAKKINKKRLAIWNRYNTAFSSLEEKGYIRRPIVPKYASHNGHIFYLLTGSKSEREKLLTYLKRKGILAVFHYVPLHTSPAGKKYCKYTGDMSVTNKAYDTLIRLPLFYSLSITDQRFVIETVHNFYKN